jgi:hypothetical protein
MNSFKLLTVMAITLLLFVCFAGNTVYADGGAGQSPDPPPLQPAPPSGGDGNTTFMDVIVTLLFLVI